MGLCVSKAADLTSCAPPVDIVFKHFALHIMKKAISMASLLNIYAPQERAGVGRLSARMLLSEKDGC